MIIRSFKLNIKLLIFVLVILFVCIPIAKILLSNDSSISKSKDLLQEQDICLRTDLNLNRGWKFIREDKEDAYSIGYDDAEWEPINIPHTWNNLDGQDGGDDYYRGIAWYRKKFNIDDSAENKRFYIQFDGSNLVTDVYINGNYLGNHEGGYTAFRFDITPYINVGGENIIAVKVDNSLNENIPPFFGDYTFFGGIYRDVHLLITDDIHIDTLDYASPGVYITQNNVNKKKADIEIEANIVNDSNVGSDVQITAYIVDDDNVIIDKITDSAYIDAGSNYQFKKNTTIHNPRLWDGKKDPYMYKVYVTVEANDVCKDTVVQPLGLRSFYVDPDKGFFLNGKYLDLFGASKHQDRENMGWAITNKEILEDFEFMQELGINAFRTAHYPQSQYLYDLMDEYGIVVWSELPLNSKITDSEEFDNNAKLQLIEMIRQNYNHPSIIFWGLFNEITLETETDPYELVQQLNNLAKKEDPTRLTTAATKTESLENPINWITDTIAFNTYFGTGVGQIEELSDWLDTTHETYPEEKIGISEYGTDADITKHSENPRRGDMTEEYQNIYHEAYLKVLKERPYLWGKFIWNLFDFAVDYRQDGLNIKGLATYDRKVRKDSFYLYKANWSDEPVLYITSRRFNPRKAEEIDVKVYSNMDWVKLKVNDKYLGRKKGEDGIFIWEDVELKEGENVVVATGKKDGKYYYDKVVWVRELSNDATLSSTEVGINNDKEFIANLPYGTTVETFNEVIALPQGAVFTVYESDGITPVDKGIIDVNMKVEVTAEDGITTKTYTVIEGPISLGKNITTNSEKVIGESSFGLVKPSHIVDGDNETLWIDAEIFYPQWWKIDLGTIYNLTEIENRWLDIFSENDIQQYKIEVSNDDETYQTVVDRSDNTIPKYTQDSLDIPARYVKVTITGSDLEIGPPSYYQAYGTFETTVRGGLITSDKYAVDMDGKKIIIPYETDVKTFVENVTFAPGATYKITQSDGVTEVTIGNIENGMKVIVTAENGINKEAYEIIQTPPEANNEENT